MNYHNLWYKNFYEDVRKSGVNPKKHYLHFGIKENRFGSYKDFPFSMNFMDYINYRLYIIYLIFINKNLDFFANIFKKIICYIENLVHTKMVFNLIVINPWFSGGTLEAYRSYYDKFYCEREFVLLTGIKNLSDSKNLPMLVNFIMKGKVAKTSILYFPTDLIKSKSKQSKFILHFNHCFDMEALFTSLLVVNNIKIFYFVHDFYLLTSNLHLYDEERNKKLFLNVEVKINPNKKIDLSNIIKSNIFFISPSLSMTNLISPYLPKERIKTIYHPENANLELIKTNNFSKRKIYNIAIIGYLGNYKGLSQVENIIRLCMQKNLSFKFFHFGTPKIFVECDKYVNFAQFDRSQIVNKLHEFSIDFSWLPFQCEESYSFTISDTLLAGLPLITTKIKVAQERNLGRNSTLFLEENDSEDSIIDAFNFFINSKYNLETRNLSNNFYINESTTISNLRKRPIDDYLFLFTM